MPQAACSFCAAPIIDETSMVEHQGRVYCCDNCALAAEGMPPAVGGAQLCAHCGASIADVSTMIEREGLIYCCANCAAATAPSPRRHGQVARPEKSGG